mmetsp:Transcript_5397/g.10849  ORF Transcript_5397/g.10849 Transcript_5397/m.10849 type:complete len:201 (+) Transcript_5397:1818-2420(+)
MKPLRFLGAATTIGRELPMSSRSPTFALASGAGSTPIISFSSAVRFFVTSEPAFSSAAASACARLKSAGYTWRNLPLLVAQSARIFFATSEPVTARCSSMSCFTSPSNSALSGPYSFLGSSSIVHPSCCFPVGSQRYARPPDMPAAKLMPTLPSTTTRPPVMYSQPWSPQPSTTAYAPELRTAKRSAATPRAKNLPPVAP